MLHCWVISITAHCLEESLLTSRRLSLVILASFKDRLLLTAISCWQALQAPPLVGSSVSHNHSMHIRDASLRRQAPIARKGGFPTTLGRRPTSWWAFTGFQLQFRSNILDQSASWCKATLLVESVLASATHTYRNSLMLTCRLMSSGRATHPFDVLAKATATTSCPSWCHAVPQCPHWCHPPPHGQRWCFSTLMTASDGTPCHVTCRRWCNR